MSQVQPRLRRRAALGWLGGAMGAAWTACTGGSETTGGMGSSSSGGSSSAGSSWAGMSSSSSGPASSSRSPYAPACLLTPRETPGPFPLTAFVQTTAAVRRDITEGRPGLPLTLRMRLLNVPGACAPIPNAAVHVWHCDKDGVYSGYAQPGVDATGETFMRGIQLTGEDGVAEFATIFPGWYPGRVTHIHFQIYLENNTAVMATATSQLAFPDAIITQVYATSTYANRGANSTVAGVARDAVFADGSALQIVSVTGDPSVGLLATLDVGITAPG